MRLSVLISFTKRFLEEVFEEFPVIIEEILTGKYTLHKNIFIKANTIV